MFRRDSQDRGHLVGGISNAFVFHTVMTRRKISEDKNIVFNHSITSFKVPDIKVSSIPEPTAMMEPTLHPGQICLNPWDVQQKMAGSVTVLASTGVSTLSFENRLSQVYLFNSA